uniref:Uncharacterized protein n=1 Tax=Romanomermis culicivorax TaxID=13658 RepID=A0A915JTH4_ROMCU
MIFHDSFCGAPLLCKLSAPPVVHFADLHVDFPIATLPATVCPTNSQNSEFSKKLSSEWKNSDMGG